MRISLLVCLALLVLVPAAAAQQTGTMTLKINGLGGAPVQSDASVTSLPFTVEVDTQNVLCVGQSTGSVPVTLTAKAADENLSVQVTPSTMMFEFPVQAGASSTKTLPGTLLVAAHNVTEAGLAANVTLTATAGTAVNCQLPPAAPAPQTAMAGVHFSPKAAQAVTPPKPVDQVPATPLGLVVVGVGLLALALRRKN